MIDRKFFYNSVRVFLFNGTLSQQQVNGMNTILDTFEDLKIYDLRWCAYPLATTFHETDREMWPINEYGGDAYYTRLYDVTGLYPARARSMGNVNPGDGIKYHGRGYVQLTWANNYRALGTALKLDLLNKPELALEPVNAARILFRGMIDGTFTTRKLADYFTASLDEPEAARQIINGDDHAEDIAVYHDNFLNALEGNANA